MQQVECSGDDGGDSEDWVWGGEVGLGDWLIGQQADR